MNAKMEYVESDLAWCAGFFDGEGSTMLLKAQRDKYIYIRMCVSQKDRRCLDKFLSIINKGKIYKANTREIHNWYCYKQEDVEEVAKLLWPFLSEVKKDQYLDCVSKVVSNKKGLNLSE